MASSQPPTADPTPTGSTSADSSIINNNPTTSANPLYPLNLHTARLRLREFRDHPDDYFLSYRLESIPEVVRYQDWAPRTLEQATAVVRSVVAHSTRAQRDIVELAVFLGGAGEDEDGEFVGRVGARLEYRDGGAEGGGSEIAEPKKAHLWYSFMPAAQGKGYAREAVEALIEVLKRAGVGRMEIECDPRNEGSKKLAERLGFVKIKETERAWESKGEWVDSVEFAKDF